jgi:circadian clock protein KaiC
MSAPQKSLTGVPGLDTVLAGGFPRGRLYLLQGTPGSGKTTLALQILLEGVKRNEKCLYITLSETKDELAAVAESHGWSLDSFSVVHLSGICNRPAEEQNTLFHASEVELTRMTELLLEAVKEAAPSLIVLDSLSEMRLLAKNSLRFRQQILAFKQVFAERGCSVWLLDDSLAEPDQQLESVTHGVVRLSTHAAGYGAERRQLLVTKLRGVKYLGGLHDYRIITGGVQVFPRVVATDSRVGWVPHPISSGISNLDALLGGGIDLGTSSVFMGPAGTGKSTLALQFVTAALERGERALFFTFDESLDTVIARGESLKMPIRKHLNSGHLRMRQIDPAETSPGELGDSIRHEVENGNVRVLVIDSLNGYIHSMPDERYLTLMLHELLMYLNQHGVASILVLTQQGLVGQMPSSVELTYLADTVLILRYFESAGAVRQAVSVIKKRSGLHERTLREFLIGNDGIHVGEALSEFEGVLTGVPNYTGKSHKMLNREH